MLCFNRRPESALYLVRQSVFLYDFHHQAFALIEEFLKVRPQLIRERETEMLVLDLGEKQFDLVVQYALTTPTVPTLPSEPRAPSHFGSSP